MQSISHFLKIRFLQFFLSEFFGGIVVLKHATNSAKCIAAEIKWEG